MATEPKILTSRRAYEYGPDGIRLTVLSTPGFQQAIQQVFNFQLMQMVSPPPLFGRVPQMVPPGLVFSTGVHMLPNNNIIPIRALHVEPRRLVFDVAGPSADIDPVYMTLMEIVAPARATDGTPVINEPVKVQNYSEATVNFSFAPDALLPPAMRAVLLDSLELNAGEVLVPLLEVRAVAHSTEYEGALMPQAFHLELRAGATPDQKYYFSGAPLESDPHLQLLRRVADLFTSNDH